MPKYQVQRDVEMWVEVEAKSEDDALEKACELSRDEWTVAIQGERVVKLKNANGPH